MYNMRGKSLLENRKHQYKCSLSRVSFSSVIEGYGVFIDQEFDHKFSSLSPQNQRDA